MRFVYVMDPMTRVLPDKDTSFAFKRAAQRRGHTSLHAEIPDVYAVDAWGNASHFVDYQDCQYAASAKMLCGGVTNLPQTPAAGGSGATYELGGIGLIDLRSHAIVHEVPFQRWSTAGHVMTRNPLKVAADGNRLTLWAAPDNGDEGSGTELYTFEAGVKPAG